MAEVNENRSFAASDFLNHPYPDAESNAAILLPHLKPTDKILDFRCGSGIIAISLASRVPHGAVVGIDFAPNVISKARASLVDHYRWRATYPPGHQHPPEGAIIFHLVDSIVKLPYDDNTFDVVYASDMFIQIVTETLSVEVLKEMMRVLKFDGFLFTRDIAKQHLFPSNLGFGTQLTQNLLRCFCRSD
ncbi:S-adenosyl-L-methionine-dependent methyltransferase [Hypoxylon fuscum]|nr:S-adenosyl-L-methionine-dependent methyltransferase [Hypoxylon fuscum]